MKKFLFVISLALLMPDAFSQNVTEEVIRIFSEYMPEVFDQYMAKMEKESKNRFENRKQKGYFNTTQMGMLRGNTQITEHWSTGWYDSGYTTSTEMQISPSLTTTNGYMFNEHWAAGIGVGFEIFERNFFPVFADIRYTLRDSKISPFFALKGGYLFCNSATKHYDNLTLPHEPYHISDVDYRNYDGLMLHPEIGVKIPISDNADILFTIAYRYQKSKSKVLLVGQTMEGNRLVPIFDEWVYKEDLNRIFFGVAVMFR